MYQAGATQTLSGAGRPRRALTEEERGTLRGLGPLGVKLADARPDAQRDPLSAWLWRGLQGSLSASPREAELKASWLQAKTEADPRALDAFIKHESAFLRARIAGNPNLSAAQQRALAGDDAWFVRLAVALRPDVPVELLRELSGDGDVRVRRVVAMHPSLPQELREVLLHDKKKKVRRAAASRVTFPIITKRVHPPNKK